MKVKNGLLSICVSEWPRFKTPLAFCRCVFGMVAALTGLCALAADVRPAAPWPPPAGKLKLIIDTDAGNEFDDQYAISSWVLPIVLISRGLWRRISASVVVLRVLISLMRKSKECSKRRV